MWSVDDVPYHRFDKSADHKWVFDKPFFLLIDLAMGGLLGGEPGGDDYGFTTLVVDYVRVYAPPKQ